MRELNVNEHTKVVVMDEAGVAGANHLYEVQAVEATQIGEEELYEILGEISFQNGALKEAGVNGVQNEDLLSIVIDRLEGFQRGDFACDANARALELIKNALDIMYARTAERRARGVEGLCVK